MFTSISRHVASSRFLPPVCCESLFAVTVLHAEKLLCCSLLQRPGEEGRLAWEHHSPLRRPVRVRLLSGCVFQGVKLVFFSSCPRYGVTSIVQGLPLPLWVRVPHRRWL